MQLTTYAQTLCPPEVIIQPARPHMPSLVIHYMCVPLLSDATDGACATRHHAKLFHHFCLSFPQEHNALTGREQRSWDILHPPPQAINSCYRRYQII